MAADNFRSGIQINVVRPRVPADDIAGAVEHEDRVVRRPVHEQAKTLFALPQHFLLLNSVGQLFAQRPIDRLRFERSIVYAHSKLFVRRTELRHRALALTDQRAQHETRHHQRAGVREQKQQRRVRVLRAEGSASL